MEAQATQSNPKPWFPDGYEPGDGSLWRDFDLYFDLKKASEGPNGEWFVEGIASTQDRDLQGETVIQRGLDISYLKVRGDVDWEHRGFDSPAFLIGDIAEARFIDFEGALALYVKAKLNKGKQVARDAWEDLKARERYGSNKKLGWSVQGKTLLKDQITGRVERAWLYRVSLTANPINTHTFADIVKAICVGPWCQAAPGPMMPEAAAPDLAPDATPAAPASCGCGGADLVLKSLLAAELGPVPEAWLGEPVLPPAPALPHATPEQTGAIVSMLNDLVTKKWGAWMKWVFYSNFITGPYRDGIAEEFLRHAQDELQHLAVLSRKVLALGGIPSNIAPGCSVYVELPDILAYIVERERDAIAAFTSALESLDRLGCKDPGLRHELEQIVAQDQQHAEETDRLRARVSIQLGKALSVSHAAPSSPQATSGDALRVESLERRRHDDRDVAKALTREEATDRIGARFPDFSQDQVGRMADIILGLLPETSHGEAAAT